MDETETESKLKWKVGTKKLKIGNGELVCNVGILGTYLALQKKQDHCFSLAIHF